MQTYVIVIKIKVQSLQKMYDIKLQNVYKDYCQALSIFLSILVQAQVCEISFFLLQKYEEMRGP